MTAFQRRAALVFLISASLDFSSSCSFLYAQSPTPANSTQSIALLLPQLEDYVKKGMQKTGVPGVAVAIVYQDKVVYLKGFGVRRAGESAPVDADTVFQLASMSKPLASTVVATLVSAHMVSWDDKIVALDPEFKLSDANVTANVTIRDLLSHRSGLPTSAGDMLEDLGFSRPEILHQMRYLPMAGEFRKSFHYSNFAFTEGGIAPAKKVGESWEELAEERLFKPLGMKETSYRWSDYRNAEDKADIHVLVDEMGMGKAVPRYLRNPDAEAPAGSASSSVRDLAQWVRLQLADGKWNGKQIIAADVLAETHAPQIERGKNPATGNTSSYAIGWGLDQDPEGRLIVGHSGAFTSGAGTTVQMMPGDHLGIVVLTNAEPTGLAEAVAVEFLDLFHSGKESKDWLSVTGEQFKKVMASAYSGSKDYSKMPRPAAAAAAKPLSAYTGAYRNDYYGQIEITEDNGSLWMRLPAEGSLYSLTLWDGDTFVYRYKGEPGAMTRGVKFTLGDRPEVLVENLAEEGSGTFTKVGP